MLVGFSRTLGRMGKFRIGAYFRLSGNTALLLCLFIAIFYIIWYTIILFGWMLYGFCWAVYKFFGLYYQLFRLCAKGIKKLFGKGKEQTGNSYDNGGIPKTRSSKHSDRIPQNKVEAQMLAPQYQKRIQDCVNLINTTKTPAVFFERYDILQDLTERMAYISKWVKMSGGDPYEEMNHIAEMRPQATKDFIDRYAQEARLKIYELATEKAKKNKADAFLNILTEYSDKIDDGNIVYMTEIYNSLVIIAG